MTDRHAPHDLEEFPSEIQVREGGSIPVFLKLTYVGFTLFGLAYFFLYYAGDGAPLVKLLNVATGH
jgi:hypothetical protein